MNFLSSGYISKCSRKIWRNSCCLDSNDKLQYYVKKNTGNKINAFAESLIALRPRFPCMSTTSNKSTGLILWTQIRFQKEWPKLHRDIKYPSFDDYRKEKFKDLSKTTWFSGDDKQGYTYAIGFLGFLCGMYGVKAQMIHYLSSMSAPADVLALASIVIDIGNVASGSCYSFKWRGKPLFVKHRTAAEISAEANTPLALLRDPETPEQRTKKPEWLIVIGICTHLGCVPVANSGDWAGGFYCPCHGSHYDNVGRARKGPAPTNLEVPPYTFLSDTTVLVVQEYVTLDLLSKTCESFLSEDLIRGWNRLRFLLEVHSDILEPHATNPSMHKGIIEKQNKSTRYFYNYYNVTTRLEYRYSKTILEKKRVFKKGDFDLRNDLIEYLSL